MDAVARTAVDVTAIRTARVAFVSCYGLSRGGPQFRCVDAARHLTASGVPAACVDGQGCAQSTLEQKFNGARLQSIVVLKRPPAADALTTLRRHASTLLLDLMDQPPWLIRGVCHSPFDAYIADNARSWATISSKPRCPRLRGASVSLIEHPHTIARPVSNGRRQIRRALLVQEHREEEPQFCEDLHGALPPGVHFDCFLLQSDARRARLFAAQLNISVSSAREAMSRPGGTGRLFADLFSLYDLLVVWRPTNHTVQRLTNALATGVPTIARDCAAFRAAFGVLGGDIEDDVLLARNLSELGAMTLALRKSAALRTRVSRAGVRSAARFSPEAIAREYARATGTADLVRQRLRRIG